MADIANAAELFDLSGEVALVTGASSGLGKRFAEVLAANGARVVAAARRTDRLAALAAENPNIKALALDVTASDRLDTALNEAEALFGPLTLLVNNAGIARGTRIVDTPEEDWRAVQDTNVDAVWHLSRAFAGRLIARGAPGAIVNIASVASYMVADTSAAYAVSKAAVLQLTKAQAREWARHGIRVNAITPGYLHSEMTEDYLASAHGQAMVKRIPQRRAGEPSDLDGVLLLLASKRASGFMTGTAITVDGGLMLS